MAVPQEVQDLVDLQYNTKQAETQRALEALRQNLQNDVSTQQNYGQLGDQKLSGVYGELNGRLEDVNTRTSDLYNQAEEQLKAIYGEAGQQQSSAMQDALASLSGTANKLGLGDVAYEPANKLRAYMDQMQAKLAGSRANSLASNRTLGTNINAQSLRAIGDAAHEGILRRGDLTQQVAAQIQNLQQQAKGKETDLLGSLQDIANEKGLALRNAMNEYNAAQSGGGSGGGGGSRGGSRGGSGSTKATKPKAYSGGLGLEMWKKEGNNGKGVSSGTKKIIDHFISSSQRHTKNQYSYAVRELQDSPAYKKASPAQRAAMRKGIDIYYKKYKG